MHKWLFMVIVLSITTARAQYYYNDILSNRTARDNYLQLKKSGIRQVTVASYNPDGNPTEGFSVKQQVSNRNNTVETVSTSAYSNPSVLTSIYNSDGWPQSATDSTDGSVARIVYTYANGTTPVLSSVSSATGFPGESSNLFKETRLYTFAGEKPLSMIRTKNGRDTLKVSFITEEQGWIGEERWFEKGKPTEIYYYYYDPSGRVTDVAHYNKTARKILPDYTFEYDTSGRLASMMTILNGTNQYRTWRYTYDSRGLKIGEVVYNKYKQQEGKLVYTYE